jgi:hypothetical protein
MDMQPPPAFVQIAQAEVPPDERDGTLFKGPRSIDEVKLAGPMIYVKLYGATSFDIQYTNYRQPY